MEIIKYILLGLLGVFLLYWLLVIVSAYCFVNPKKIYDKDSSYFRWLLYSTSMLVVFLLRIRVKVTGEEKLPEGRFVLVQNHRSNFDAILTYLALKKYNLAFISKEENLKIPIWGRIIRKCCFLGINREDPRKAIPTIKKAAEYIKDDQVSIGVYPEGTRSKKCLLLDFHAAVFKIAQMAKVPVVVTTMQNTENMYKEFFYKRSYVYLDIVEVIPADEVVALKSTELSNKVRGIIEKQLSENKKS